MKFCTLLVLVLVACAGCSGGPSEVQLIKDVLNAYIQELEDSLQIDPKVVLEEGELRTANPEAQGFLETAAREVGVATGNALDAKACAEFVASLSVPEVIAERPAWPPGCETLTRPVFVMGFRRMPTGLLVYGRGWDKEFTHEFRAEALGNGQVNLSDIVAFPNMW